MPKDYLYCEETDTRIYHNDVLTITTYPNVKFIAKNGWYTLGTARKRGWYFVSIADKSILPVDAIDLTQATKGYSEISSSGDYLDETEGQEDNIIASFLYCESSHTKIYNNDFVKLTPDSDRHYVAKFGYYTYNGIYKLGWYFLSEEDKSIIPLSDVDINTIIKEEQNASPIMSDMDAIPAAVNYIVIPGTDIRLYDDDIVKISTRPEIKWIVHCGWYIYDDVQNYGWYFVSIKDGEILPVSAVDLTLCTLVTMKTQGSELYDGKVVNYTRPFTESDANILRRTFITFDTIEQRDNLDHKKLVNGKMVRVNDVNGEVQYYSWNESLNTWEKLDWGSGSGIPELEGTEDNPVVLSHTQEGLYRVIGYFKVSCTDETTKHTDIDYLVFVSGQDEIQIEVITDKDITDYTVEDDEITFEDSFATKGYVDDKIQALEDKISEIISELVAQALEELIEPISDDYIRSLFA